MSIAITAGSRGITEILFISITIAESLRSMGAKTFLDAAIGSNGGGTVEGETHILHHGSISMKAQQAYRRELRMRQKMNGLHRAGIKCILTRKPLKQMQYFQ